MIKLCAIDLDGTLLDNNRQISDINKKALKDAQSNGCKIVIASGRPQAGIRPFLKELSLIGMDNYIIAFNGAKVIDLNGNITIHSSTITGKDIKYLYALSKKLDVNFHAFDLNERLLTDLANPYTDEEANLNKITYQLFDFTKVKDNDGFLKCMMVSSDEKLTKAMQALDKSLYNKYSIVRSSKIFLEFLNPKADKGNALKVLSKHLNLAKAETMAIGDAGNDVLMIKIAGIGVAMANAFDETKKVANYLTTSNEENGVAKAINHFINLI